jgi:PAS domain S-box-containing protein
MTHHTVPAPLLSSVLLEGFEGIEFLEQIVDAIADPIFVKDEDHRWIMINQALCTFMGHPREELLGKSDYDFFPKEEADVFWAKDEEVFASGVTNINEESFTDGEGTTHTIVTKKSIFTDKQGKKILVGSIRDITELKATQDALNQVNLDLEDRIQARTKEVLAARELLLHAQKMDAIGKLAGGVAHDFNNLLAVVGGTLELIVLRGAGDRDLEELAEPALDAVRRGSTMTHRMLAFSRQQDLRPQPTDLRKLLTGAEILLRRSLEASIEFSFTIDSPTLISFVDAAQLETALLNLCINARDAMPEGGHLKVNLRRVDIGKRRASELGDIVPGPYVLIEVRDNGHGMDADTLEQAFEPFFSTRDASGLGLSMVYGFAKQSDGHVTATSVPGEGTTVQLFLPRLPGLHVFDGGSGTQLPNIATGAGRTVMVVEDEPSVRTLTVMFLQALGYTTHSASSISDALEQAQKLGRFDVLLTDMILGPMQYGDDLAFDLKKEHPDIKVMYMTGYADESLRQRLMGDSTPLIQKPFRLIELDNALYELLSEDA